MSDLKEHQLVKVGNGEQMKLSLWQKPNPGGIPVLLLHGASANHRTFLNPVADNGDPRCLADFLFAKNFEPWLLDWRGNGRIELSDLQRLRDQLDFDWTAKIDIPMALEKIVEVSHPEQICAVGHCMGAATLAQAIARGYVGKPQRLTHVVLMAIGLFYEPALDGRLKSQDHALERLWAGNSAQCVAIDPRPNKTWPKEFDEIYGNWPASLRPHQQPESSMDEICNKVSFMFGQPYRERNLHPEAHRGTFLEDQFGAIPLRMYLQCAQNIRRGWAAEFGAMNDDDRLIDHAAQERFADLEQVTLLTGAKNEIWHRDSIDRMYEWLSRSRLGRLNSHREILRDYAHQDLLWGRTAYLDVFPMILNGLASPDGASDGGTDRRPPLPPRRAARG
jgi:cholesterol oxidase